MTLYGVEWSVSRSGRFTPGERVASTHCTEGYVGPETYLDVVAKTEIPLLTGNRTPVVQLLARHYTNF